MTLGDGVESVGDNAFVSHSVNLELKCEGTTVIPTIGNGSFNNYGTVSVEVPAGYEDQYSADKGWTGSIVVEQVDLPTSITDIDSNAAPKVYYDLQGHKLGSQPTKKGLYISNRRLTSFGK